jgi:ubiquinone/menaquinone biosynthesis C-methylase UbiE
MMRADADGDYRASHIDKGADYDASLTADPFHRYMTQQEAAIIDRLTNRVFPGGVPRYLDFACGTGRITAQVEKAATESYAIDVSDKMVTEARRKCVRTRFRIIDITRHPFDLEQIDLVTAFRFFANAEGELREDALEALRRVMRPGAYLLLNNHRNSWSIRNLLLRASGQEQDGCLSPPELERLLFRHGFTVVRSVGVGLWLWRARIVRPELLDSRLARILEPLSRLRILSSFCPDVVVLARLRRS